MKITVGVFFGGVSTEHEVSIITGLQACAAIDKRKYDVVPVYISKDGAFYIGDDIGKIESYSNIPTLLKRSKTVTLLPPCHAVTGNATCAVYELVKKIDMRKPLCHLNIALPCVHGNGGEDGGLQGFFETLKLPYVGSDVTASAVGMDKAAAKSVLRAAGVPVLDWVVFTVSDFLAHKQSICDKIAEQVGFPAVVKPVNLGSSIGIGIAGNAVELEKSVETAMFYTDRILAEPAITNLTELNVAVLGDRHAAEASECEQPLNSGGLLSFDDKYSGGKDGKGGSNTKSGGMASLKRKIPADITPQLRDEIRSMAVRAFRELGCSGVARIDFLYDNDKNELYFNEINTIPGSLSFYLWEPLGLKYGELLGKMFTLATKRVRDRSQLCFAFESNILTGFKGGSKGGKV